MIPSFVSFILYSEALFLVFQKCFYESLTKIKKVNNTGILLIELDIHCYEEVHFLLDSLIIIDYASIKHGISIDL